MIDLVLDVVSVLQTHLPVLALHMSDGDDSHNGGLALLLAGPAAGAALYAAIYRYYRNADKTHQFEKETLIQLKDQITWQDKKVDEVKGTRERSIRGDNSRNYRSRVAKLD